MINDTECWQDIVENDIKVITDILKRSVHEEKYMHDVLLEMDGKYQACIDKWDHGYYSYSNSGGFDYSMCEEAMLSNLSLICHKLQAYKYRVNEIKEHPETKIDLKIANSVDIKISLKETREKIEDMTALSNWEIKEIKEKIDVIETILNSDDVKNKKWEKLGPILKWVADKGVDVGVQLIPLFIGVSK